MLLEGEKKHLVISDLHLGIEGTMGMHLGRNPADPAIYRVSKMLDITGADSLVLLGDVKSGTSRITSAEWDSVPGFLEKMADKVDVTLVPGNHDGGISYMIPDCVSVSGQSGMIIEGALLTHGHALPPESFGHVDRLVMGHVHPVFRKEGSVLRGNRVWVHMTIQRGCIFPSRGGTLGITVMPSFGSVPGTGRRKSTRKSPILARADPLTARIVTLDGSIIGDESMLDDVL
ncbi:ICC-like phosphoesterase [Cenarchaeum symbiosum A]|uniref:ICC-like phosphoesterase n=1 Tax=Cenarchaeum symbiosum (strain A) TaxID=414004 RepID=A0RVN4_CENSY|nr:ICC-like phosphoesterase [Cenarchaeum symbiosum A]